MSLKEIDHSGFMRFLYFAESNVCTCVLLLWKLYHLRYPVLFKLSVSLGMELNMNLDVMR